MATEITPMTQANHTEYSPTPLHLWIIGVLSLLWNSFGSLNYSMTHLRNEAYLEGIPQEALDFVWNSPAWVTAGWAMAVWCGLFASILLLLRKGFATPVFLLSLICAVAINVYNYGFGGAMEVMGSAKDIGISVIIIVLAILQWMYARAMVRCGVLR
ncbi:MAG: hypothetical protein QF489_04520 [Planctomycetota bacterium]|jgi:hypothetical protein|nr:hypothetical protein [Planctomycetota bacterium]